MKKLILLITVVMPLLFTSCNIIPVNMAAKAKITAASATDVRDKPENNGDTIFKVQHSISASGQVTASIVRNITIDFPAIVEKVNVNDGQKVEGGEPLLTLNLEEYEAQIKSMELDIQSLDAEILQNKNAPLDTGDSLQMKRLMNDLQLAQEVYAEALKDLDDKQKLFTAGSISRSDLDDLQKAADEKKREIDNINLSIEALRTSAKVDLKSRSAQLSTQLSRLQSDLSKLETDLKLLKSKMDRPYIRNNEIISDIQNGIVFEITCASGDNISTNTKVLSILDLDSLIVRADISEKSIKDVKIGADVTMALRADRSREYKGRVTRISNVPFIRDGEAFTPVEISIDYKDDYLLPNYFVNVKISVD